jgi:hypothetical protein
VQGLDIPHRPDKDLPLRLQLHAQYLFRPAPTALYGNGETRVSLGVLVSFTSLDCFPLLCLAANFAANIFAIEFWSQE